MKNQIVLATLSLVLATNVGCKQSNSFQKGNTSVQSLGCASNKAVDVSDLSIQGSPGAAPGQPVQYNLSQNLDCSTSQSVTWTDASGAPAGTGSSFAKSYSKSGIYVVAAQVQSSGSLAPTEISMKTVVTPGLALNGPQVGMAEVDNTFSLVIPSGAEVSAVEWNFGDGSALQSGLGPIDYAFVNAGAYTVTVTVTLASGDTSVVTHAIQILPPYDGGECINQMTLTGPTTATVGAPVSLNVFIPSCVSWRVRSVQWTYGDGSASDFNQSVTHTFAQAGNYHVTVAIYSGESTTPYVTLSTDIVVAAGEEPPPPDPGTNPLSECSAVGLQRLISGELYTEDAVCGVNGHRTDSYRDQVTQECRLSGEILKWVEISRSKRLVNEGACQGQACEVPASALNGLDPSALGLIVNGGKYYLADGASKTFYSSTRPDGACSTVSNVRTCSNGSLGGSSEYGNLTCESGCAGIGPSGTTKVGVVTGSESVAHTCAYGETGVFDIFTQVSDQTCHDGQVSSSNTRRGSLQTQGSCPTYSWVGSESFGACSADCGGTQSRNFMCVSSTGEVVGAERCSEPAPVVTRVCDGNPDSVKRSDVSTSTEEGGQSTTCPKNQIGVVVQERVVTTTKVYACVDHSVQQVSESVVPGPWTEEKYCRDYVPYRCSQDSLSIKQAMARYQWMLKCQKQVPVIKEFLEAYDDTKVVGVGEGKSAALMYNGKTVYATFMERSGGCKDKVWKAPTTAGAECSVPENVYIAAVCTASCATPDENILVQDKHGKMAYTPFIQAWQDKIKYVATLQSNSSMSSKIVVKTEVDNWVTELMDGDHDILTFRMKSGGELKLTPNHPIVTSDGRMKVASDWAVGDSMVQVGGVRDEVMSIDKSVYFGKVYNVFVKSSSLHKNIVVTNGYLNGTAYFQNDGAQHLNKLLFRGQLVKGVLDK